MANVRQPLIEACKTVLGWLNLNLEECKPEHFKEQDETGMTPLMHAIRKQNSLALTTLLEIKDSKLVHDVGWQLEDQKGMTALMHAAACTEMNVPDVKQGKARDEINQLVIRSAHLQQNSPEEKLATFEQVIPIIVENNNISFFLSLIRELETIFPIHFNELPEPLVHFINLFLKFSVIKNQPLVAAYICQRSWSASLKKHESNIGLVLEAVQMRSGLVAALLIENNFPIESSRLLLRILNQEFLQEDKNHSVKKQVIEELGRKNPNLLNKQIIKVVSADKNLLRIVINAFKASFLFSDLIEAWDYDFVSVIEWCEESWNINAIDSKDGSLITYGAMYYMGNINKENMLQGVERLLKKGAIVWGGTLWRALACGDDSMIKMIEKYIKNCTNENDKYERSFNPDICGNKIWQYPRILTCLINHGHKIMHLRVRDFLRTRDALYLVLENYKKNLCSQHDILALIKAAKATNQLMITEEIFEIALGMGDEDLVSLLIECGAKVKTENTLLTDSALTQAVKLGHAKVVKQLLASNQVNFSVESIAVAINACKKNQPLQIRIQAFLRVIHCVAESKKDNHFYGEQFRSYFHNVASEDQCELLQTLINKFGIRKDNLLEAIFPAKVQMEAKAELSKLYDQFLQGVANEAKSVEVEPLNSHIEKKAEKKSDPLQVLRLELIHAASAEADIKQQEINRQLIADAIAANNDVEGELTLFYPIIPVIVKHNNIDFLRLLIKELEGIFPIEDNNLPEPLIDFFNRFLHYSIVNNLPVVVAFICQQPWASSLIKHKSNEDLILEAVQMRSGEVVSFLIENSFPVAEAKPSVLTRILQQDFLNENEGMTVKKQVLEAFAKKYPALLTKEDIKVAFKNKKLLSLLLYQNFVFKFQDLIEVWNDDFAAVAEFWINAKFKLDWCDSDKLRLITIGAWLFVHTSIDKTNITKGIIHLIRAGAIIDATMLKFTLESKDDTLINVIEANMSLNNFSKEKNYYTKWFFDENKPNYREKIWKYPKILLCIIQNDDIIMRSTYNINKVCDAWELVFANYTPAARADILALVQAAKDIRQLLISEQAFKLAVATGNEKLVTTLLENGASVSMFPPNSALEQAAQLGHFNIVKILLTQLNWPTKSIEAASETCKGDLDIKIYLTKIACYANTGVITNSFPYTRSMRNELIHMLVTKYGLPFEQYELRFGHLIKEYRKFIAANGNSPLLELKEVHLTKPSAPVEEVGGVIPALVRSSEDLEGISPEAQLEVIEPSLEGIPNQLSQVAEYKNVLNHQQDAVLQSAPQLVHAEQEGIPHPSLVNGLSVPECDEPGSEPNIIELKSTPPVQQLNFFFKPPHSQVNLTDSQADKEIIAEMNKLAKKMKTSWLQRHPQWHMLPTLMEQCVAECEAEQVKSTEILQTKR